MKVIYKYTLPVRPAIHTVKMPRGSEILSAANQNENLVLWVLVDPSEPRGVDREIIVFMTGQEFPPNLNLDIFKFIGTVLFDQGKFVLHVFAC